MTLQEAEWFNEVWKQKLYDGFSNGTEGQVTTLFLDALLEQLHNYQLPHVIEGGAGSGDHSFTLARRGCQVTAVEYSETAVDIIKDRKQALPCSYRNRITVIQGDLLKYLRDNTGNSTEDSVKNAQALYANSVLHFFSPDERTVVYERVRTLLLPNGLLAVSFKAEGDALQSRGEIVGENDIGVLVRGGEGDHIPRLFVRNPKELAKEIEQAGYVVPDNAIYQWKVKGYNYPGEEGKFVGFLAVKR